MSTPTPPITYTIEADLDRDGTFSSPIADLSRYVKGAISFQYGMQASYEEVSAPARMTFTVTNAGGEFDRDRLGNECVSNGGFDNWTGNVPNGWSTANEVPVTAYIRQCGSYEEVYEGGTYSGTGACGIWSVSSFTETPSLTQVSVFTPGKTYRISIPITKIGTKHFVDQLGSMGIRAMTNGAVQISPLISDEGDHIFYRYLSAGQSQLQIIPITIANQYAYGITTIDNVSVKEVALYRQLEKSTLVRLRATYLGVTQTIWTGKITDMVFVLGTNTESTVTITAEDAMLQFLDKEYVPTLGLNTTADVVIANMLDRGDLFAYPYAKSYWILGISGSSELGLTTTLPAAASSDFDTGIHTFSYVGDAADRGQGINAQQYIRDIIAAEVGRFYWDAHNAQFVMHNRSHDALNDISQLKATFTDSDLDSVQYVYGNDVVNALTVEFIDRTVGSVGSVIWSSPSVPFLLKQGSSRKINARYFDPTDSQLKIGAKDFYSIQKGVDVVANTNSDGSGTVKSDTISMTADCSATAAIIYLENTTTMDVYITALQLRGTPLTSKPDTYESSDGTSLRNNDEFPKTLSLQLMDDPDTVKNYADYQIARFKEPFGRLASITFNALRNANTLSAAINRVVGDRITVTLASGHDADYFIVGENGNITVGGDMSASITWTLDPAQRQLFWVLGTVGQSEMGTTTILGF